MADVVVIGGGLGGLASALFLARRGFDVALVERDANPPDETPDDDFERWQRPGVPQARQSHAFLGLGSRVLIREAPDVVDALLSCGVLEVPAAFQGRGAVSDVGAVQMCSRRLVFEAVMRRAVLREPRVEVVAGDTVVGLTTVSQDPPVVTGVTTELGRTIRAAVVVDATGRRSPISAWAAAIGVADLPVTVQRLGIQYLTRYYRLRPGAEFPSTDVPLRAALSYLIALAFPADNATFSLSLACFVDDPLRGALAKPDGFEQVLDAVEMTRPWLHIGTPISAVHPMARIENRWRRLVNTDGAPLLGGLVLVGDASIHTNPTFGRGVSLAFSQAQHLADALDGTNDAVEFVVDFERWTEHNLGEWFETQVEGDGATVERFQASLRGEPYAGVLNRRTQFMAAMRVLAPTDPSVAVPMARLWHLLSTPTEIMADTDLVERVDRYLSTNQQTPPAAEELDREQFERIIASQ